jgi:energy coupling factor transporter S component ThiW
LGAVRSGSRNAAAAAVLAAVAVALSPLSLPIGPTKLYPAQHMINSVGGVLLGPWYAALIAVVVAVVRNALGTGTVFAFPGGVPGALLVGLVHKYLWRKDYVALLEPAGTAIGAFVSALVVAPLALQLGSIRLTLTLEAFIIAFLVSSIPGAILGFIILLMIRRSRGLIP